MYQPWFKDKKCTTLLWLEFGKLEYSDKLNRIIQLKEELFPNGALQERQFNFTSFYLEYGASLFDKLYEKLDPLTFEFKKIILWF